MSKVVHNRINELIYMLESNMAESLSSDERMRIHRVSRRDRIQGEILVRGGVAARHIKAAILSVKKDSYQDAKRKLHAAQSAIDEMLKNVEKAIRLI